MTQEEFEALNAGDIVRHEPSGFHFVITLDHGGHKTAVTSIHLRHADEWSLSTAAGWPNHLEEKIVQLPESGVRKVDDVTTHHYQDGKSACDMTEKHGAPVTWPAGHSYSRRWPDVTCEECLKSKPAAEGA